ASGLTAARPMPAGRIDAPAGAVDSRSGHLKVRIGVLTHQLHRGDLPEGLLFGDAVAIDTEAMGLNPHRDRLCLMQLSRGDGDAHLVQFALGCYDAPNLKKLRGDPGVTKLFHFARFDVA